MGFPDIVCDNFELEWAAGASPRIEAFLEFGESDEEKLGNLVRLIEIELRFRWQNFGSGNSSDCDMQVGKPGGPLAEEYFLRFPILDRVPDARFEIIRAEYQMRHCYADQPNASEYMRRFSQDGPVRQRLLERRQQLSGVNGIDLRSYHCPNCFRQLNSTNVESITDARELVTCDACVSEHPRSHTIRFNPENPGELNDRFVILRRLGAGGMGVVFEAFDRPRKQNIAIKVLPILDPESVSRFKREFRLPSRISHKNLIQLFELLSIGERWFLTMELINGIDLVSFLRRQDPMDYPRVREVFGQLTEGIDALHKHGILHRDIKPGNVLVNTAGEVKVLDFGLVLDLTHTAVWECANDSADETTCVVGTATYMAPEQAAGGHLSTASDWYAVGVMLYDVLSGKHPFTGSAKSVRYAKQNQNARPPNELTSDTPPDLNELCLRLLDRDPSRRPPAHRMLAHLRGEAKPLIVAPLDSQPPCDEIFVGREQSLAMLLDSFQQVMSGESRLIHIRGPSGVGKTALVNHFVDKLPIHQSIIVLRGRCYERESVAYKALDELVESLVDHLIRLPPNVCQRLLPKDAGTLTRLFPAFLRCRDIAALSRQFENVRDVSLLRRRAILALRNLLSGLAVQGPLLIQIDDLQWSDEESILALAEIVRPLPGSKILFCLLSRSDLPESNSGLRMLDRECQKNDVAYQMLSLDPLSDCESTELARHLLNDDSDDSHVQAEQIATESAGAPYFIYELTYEFKRLAKSLASIGNYAVDLDDVLWNRILRLPMDARRLLQYIAIASKPTKLAHIRDAAAISRLDSALGQLRSGNLIRSSGQEFEDKIETFHDRIREAVIAHLASDDKLQIHARIANTLEAAKHPDSETIAFHYFYADAKHKAAKFFLDAAGQAANSLAFERAARLYRKSIELQQYLSEAPVDLFTRLGDAQANAGQGPEAALAYRQAAEVCSGVKQIELERRIAYQYCISGRIDEGKVELTRLLEKVGLQLPRSRSSAILQLLAGRLVHQIKGTQTKPVASNRLDQLNQLNDITWSAALGLSLIEPITGAIFQNRNLSSAQKIGDPQRLARAYAWQAVYHSIEGTPARRKTNRFLGFAKPLVETANQPYIGGLYTLSCGIADYFSGRWRAADNKCQEAIETFRDECTGVVWESVTAKSFTLWSQFFLGEVSRISNRLPELVEEARRRNDRLAEASYVNFGGTVAYLCADDPEQAQNALREAMVDWSSEEFYAQHFTSLAGWAQTEMYLGQYESAWQRMSTEWDVMRRSQILRIEAIRIFMTHLRARCALGRALQSSNPSNLFRFVRGQVRRLERERAEWAWPMALSLRACLHMAGDDRRTAAELHLDAADRFDALQMGLFAATSRCVAGQIIGETRGKTLVKDAERWMAGQLIKDPTRINELFLPGANPRIFES